jgi:general nucleoside transport system permease protein
MSNQIAPLPPLSVSGAGSLGSRRWPFGRLILEVRLDMPAWKQAVAVACSIMTGMFISAVVLIVAGMPPADLVSEFANTLDRQSLQAVLVQAAPLILVGIAASIGFRARFWNLGLEGQMVWGGIAATAVSIYQIGPEALRLPLMALFAMLAGMAWVAVPAFLRMKFAVNEIISTLLLNYVATYFLYDLLYGSWKDASDAYPHSPLYASAERLPDIGHGVNAALPLALVFVLMVWWFAEASRFGFYLKFIHANPAMGRLAGVPIFAVVWTAVLMSGALSGLGGFVVPSGIAGRLTQGFFEGYGFSGVLIAFLARNNAVAAAIVAVLIAVLFVTGQSFQIFYQIPFAMVQMIQAIIVMCVAASEFFVRHRIRLQR